MKSSNVTAMAKPVVDFKPATKNDLPKCESKHQEQQRSDCPIKRAQQALPHGGGLGL